MTTTALLAREVLQPPARGVERLMDGDMGVAMRGLDLVLLVMGCFIDIAQRAVQRGLVAHHDRCAPGHGQIDSDVVMPALVAMPMRHFGQDPASALLSSMHLYRSVPAEHLQHLLDNAISAVARSGAEALLPACAAVIPEELRASIFVLAAELVFADGRIAEGEKRFIDALQMALTVDDDTALKIVEVLLIKNRA